MYLIDTNVISEIRKGDRANNGVRAFFERALREEHDLYLSVVTVGELRRGVEAIRYRGDNRQAMILGDWLGTVLAEYAQNLLLLDAEIAQLWGHLRVPHAQHDLDKMIAATALIHNLTVVTRNVGDFAGTEVRLLNPFD